VELESRVQIAGDLTINELLMSYLQHAKTHYVKGGVQTSEFSVITTTLRILRERHGHELATSFGPLKLLALRDQWATDGITRAQVNKRMERVRRMFRWAVSRQLVPVDVLTALKTVEGLQRGRCAAKEGRKVRPVPDEHIDATLPFLNRQIRAMVQLQRLSGMRPQEVCLMKAIDIDASGKTWVYTPSAHKTEHHDRDRVIYIGPRAQEILRPWLRLNVGEFLFSPRRRMEELAAERRQARKTRVQPSQQDRRKQRPRKQPGERYTTGSYRQAIDKACDRAGIPRWKPNQLRHALATRVRAEMGLDAAQVVLGHSRADVTQVYAEKNAALAAQAMEKLG
jgi:integrase